jgi:hypothetical protein
LLPSFYGVIFTLCYLLHHPFLSLLRFSFLHHLSLKSLLLQMRIQYHHVITISLFFLIISSLPQKGLVAEGNMNIF